MRVWSRRARSVALIVVGGLVNVALCIALSGQAMAGTPVDAALARGDLAGAILSARGLAEQAPADLEAQELYIDLLMSVGRGQVAHNEMHAAMQLDPTNPDRHYLLGRASIGAADSQASYEAALKLDPNHARAHMGVASVHAATGQDAKAISGFRRAVALEPSLSEAWLGLVRTLVAAGDQAGAIDAGLQGLVAVPSEPSLYLAVATLDGSRAMDMLTTGAKVAPHDARVLAALAEAHLSLGHASQALAAANQSLAESPSMPSAMLTQMFASALVSGQLDQSGYRALISARDLQASDTPAALAEFSRLSAEYPNSALVLLGRSSVLSALSRREDALADLAAALKLNPQLVEAQAAFGLALLARGRSDSARPWLVLASSARPWDTSLGLALGKAQLSSDVPAAMATLRDLRARSPWDLSILLVYGQALQASGRNEDAYRLVRGALQQTPTPELAAAFVVAAVAAGRQAEAADFLDSLADPQAHPALHELSGRLREGATAVGPAQ